MENWGKLGNPVYIASPMVDSSEHAFRVLCRKYGAQLCYTPMLHAKMFVDDHTYRRQRFDIQPDEGPTIAQLAGDSPAILSQAATLAMNLGAAGIDLNLGCPQPIARKGHYGSALLRETELIVAAIRAMVEAVTIPVSCKIRIIDEGGIDPQARGLQATLRLVDQIESAGASFITVHGRNRLMTGKKTGQADWNAIACVKQRLSIPVVANGNIESFSDIEHCLQVTGADAVMSAESLLENPALFSGKVVSPFTLAEEYLNLANPERAGYVPIYDFNKCVKAHIARILYAPIKMINRIRNVETSGAFDANMRISQCTSVEMLLQSTSQLKIDFNNHVKPRSQWVDRTCEQVSSSEAKYSTSSNGDNICDLKRKWCEADDKSVSITVVNESNSSSDLSSKVSHPVELFDEDLMKLTWYRRHRKGSIEVDRFKRKEMQRLWLEDGLRFTR